MMKNPFSTDNIQRFSIRKCSFGATSVLLGTLFLLGNNPVSANEQVSVTEETSSIATEVNASTDAQTISSEVTVVPETEIPETPSVSEAEVSAPTESSSDSTKNSAVPDVQSADIENTEDTSIKHTENSTVSQESSTTSEADSEITKSIVEKETTSSEDKTLSNNDAANLTDETIETEEIPNFIINSIQSTASSGSVARGDDYPSYLKNAAPDTVIDPWRLFNRECTSFTAFRLHTVNGFTLPSAYGNATVWGTRAKAEGYRVDMNPAKGSVAWLNAGHVAWVSNVIGNNVEVEEYNYNHRYNKRIVAKTAFSGYIHFKDLAVTPEVKGTITIQNQNDQGGTFDVVITNVSSNSGLKEVQVPIWSSQNGQDDLVWYKATKQNNGNYKISVNIKDHKNNRGEYNIHLYYVIDSGKQIGVANAKTIIAEVKGTITIQNQNDQAGTFDVVITNVSSNSGLKEVQVPIWSSQNGQDDLVWYKATKQNDGTYKTSVNINNHKNNRGEYNIHLYYIIDSGRQLAVAITKITVADQQPEKVTGTINIQNKNDQAGTFDVVITNVSSNSGLKEVQVPIWSSQNGQDDLIWYKVTKQNDGTYKTSVNISNHKNNRGEYNVHLYYTIDSGQLVGVDAIKITIAEVQPQQPEKPTGTITIQNKNDQTGTFDIIVSNVICPAGLKEVKIPTWASQNGQDDLIWYTATKQNDGTYKVSVKATDHKNYQGEYNIHLYYVQNDGQTIGVGTTTTDVKFVARPSIPDSGSYTFTARASIKAEPKVSSPELAYYDVGNSVNYDRVLLSDGHYWISYIGFSGSRRYISIT